jgi:hypothetical protein
VVCSSTHCLSCLTQYRLTYWVIFVIFGSLETFIQLITYWIPFYFPLKVTFLLWCMHPTFNGATMIYNNFLKDLIKKHITKVDAALSDVSPSKILETVKGVVTPTVVSSTNASTVASSAPVTDGAIATPITPTSSSPSNPEM